MCLKLDGVPMAALVILSWSFFPFSIVKVFVIVVDQTVVDLGTEP
jgi:hypothetical protein